MWRERGLGWVPPLRQQTAERTWLGGNSGRRVKRKVKRADPAANNHRRSVSQTDTGTGYPGSPSRGEVVKQRSHKVRLGAAAKHMATAATR